MVMTDPSAGINSAIEEASPALAAALSPLGRRLVFPPGIPFQAAQARGKAFNGTIGQVTDGAGHALALPSLEAALAGLDDELRNRAFLYSPIAGLPGVRQAWQERQRAGQPAQTPETTLPIVTVGLTHGLSIVADMVTGEGTKVVIPDPLWGNYRQIFSLRRGAEIVPAPAYREGPDGPRYDPSAVATALDRLPEGEPAVAIVNLPSNPGGYSLTAAERTRMRASLVAAAERRPLVVVCDDAYAGLVYEDDIPRASLFWELLGAHPNLVPVKIEGATKELSFFGGRVGFVTFPFAPESEIAAALESKVMSLIRSTVGSPVAASQAVVLRALGQPQLDSEIEALRQRLAGRYRLLRDRLARLDPALVGRVLPFNSGCFALIELAAGIDPEALRRHLLEHHDTGLIAIAPRYLRIAFCSVRSAALEELVTRLERGAAELAAALMR
jgi:aspartate/methionine/tyrosine aminotransferase